MVRPKWIPNAARVGLVLLVLLVLLGLCSGFNNLLSVLPIVLFIGTTLFGPGIVLALVLLLPPIKKLTRRSDKTKAATSIVMAAVSFVVTFPILMVVCVVVVIAIYSMNNDQIGALPEQVTTIAFDLWRREILPPFIRQSQPACYESDPVICHYVQICTDSSGPFGADSWGSYLIVAVASLPSMSLCVGLSDYFVGRKQEKKEQVETDLPAHDAR